MNNVGTSHGFSLWETSKEDENTIGVLGIPYVAGVILLCYEGVTQPEIGLDEVEFAKDLPTALHLAQDLATGKRKVRFSILRKRCQVACEAIEEESSVSGATDRENIIDPAGAIAPVVVHPKNKMVKSAIV